MKKKEPVEATITEHDIQSSVLRKIYNGEVEEAQNEFTLLCHEKNWLRDFQFDLLMGFWFAIHCEEIELTVRLMEYDIYLRQLVALALLDKSEKPDGYVIPTKDETFMGMQKLGKLLQKKVVKETHKQEFDMKISQPSIAQSSKQDDEEELEGGSEEEKDEAEVSEYDEEENEVESEENPSIKSLDWVKPVINPRQLLEDLQSLDISQASGIGDKDGDDDDQGEIDENQLTFKIPFVKMNDRKQESFLQQIGLTGFDIEMLQLSTPEHMTRLKKALRLRFPVLMASICKILLFRGEIKLALLLTSMYEISLDLQMIENAIEFKQYEWLSYVWAFGKNFEGARRQANSRRIFFVDLFEMIKCKSKTGKDLSTNIGKICSWYLHTDDNILHALLQFNQDRLALEFMGWYKMFLQQDLFLFALQEAKNAFMQGALLKGAFQKSILSSEHIISHLLAFLEEGSKTNYILNVLLLSDVTGWRNKQLQELVDMFDNFASETFENNRLLLSYNPMLSIALSADLLTKIAKSRRRFQDQCTNLKVSILALGKVFNAKIEDESFYKQLILDRDFQDRTVLSIICNQNLEQLMSEDDPKAESLIMSMWKGSESTKCDGNIFGYSNLAHILLKKSKKVTDSNTSYFKICNNYFTVNTTVDYTFQHQYRSKDISYFFMKELVFAVLLLAFYQLAMNDYKEGFKGYEPYFVFTPPAEPEPETADNSTDLTNITSLLRINSNITANSIPIINLPNQTFTPTNKTTIPANKKKRELKGGSSKSSPTSNTTAPTAPVSAPVQVPSDNNSTAPEEEPAATDEESGFAGDPPGYYDILNWKLDNENTENLYATSALYGLSYIQPQVQLVDPEKIKEKYMQVKDDFKNQWPIPIVFLSSSIILCLLQKLQFNTIATLKKKPKIPIDKWQILDVVFASTSMALVLFITSLPISVFLSETLRHDLSYVVVFVGAIQYLRVFLYFLLIGPISKMLLTLYKMIVDTIPFMVLLGIFLFICAALFTTLFQDTDDNIYSDIPTTIIILFNALVGTYANLGIGVELEPVHIILTNIFVFMFNVLLLNFLIGIMSTTYEAMLGSGSFMFKVNLYNYCERYLIAYLNEAYGELVLHAAPVSILTTPLMILSFMLPEKFMVSVSKFFSYMMFWLENCIFLLFFIVFEILLIVPVYFKNVFVIAWASLGLFTTFFNVVIWIFTGLFISFYIAATDVVNLIQILRMHEGCRKAQGMKDELEEEEIKTEDQINAFNEARDEAILMYLEITNGLRKKRQEKEEDKEQKQEDDVQDDVKVDVRTLEILKMLEDDEEELFGKMSDNDKSKAKQIFVVKLSNIHDEWRKKKSKSLKENQDALENDPSKKKKVEGDLNQQKLQDNLISKNKGQGVEIIKEIIRKQGAQSDGEEEEKNDEPLFNPEDVADKEVEKFLSMFLIGSESTFLDQIDLVLMLKAQPQPITEYNLAYVKLFNFNILQQSIIAFLNEEIVNAFEFYDQKNRDRVSIVRDLIINQKTNLDRVENIMTQVKTNVQQNENILIEFQEMWIQLQEEKAQIERTQMKLIQEKQMQENEKDGKGKKKSQVKKPPTQTKK